jgi:hypothetical protein
VSIGKEKQIFSFSIHLEVRIVVELIKIEGYKILSTAKGCTWVARLHGMNHA